MNWMNILAFLGFISLSSHAMEINIEPKDGKVWTSVDLFSEKVVHKYVDLEMEEEAIIIEHIGEETTSRRYGQLQKKGQAPQEVKDQVKQRHLEIEKRHEEVLRKIQLKLSSKKLTHSPAEYETNRGKSILVHKFSKAFAGISLKGISKEELSKAIDVSDIKIKIHPDLKVQSSMNKDYSSTGVPAAHNYLSSLGMPLKGNGMKIGIIDTGIDYTHPSMGGCMGPNCKVLGGYDFVNNDSDPRDDHGHGTHVANIAAGLEINGFPGVAPAAKLYAYKVLSASGSGATSGVIKGIEACADPNNDGDFSDHLDVCNLSLGSSSGNPDSPSSVAIDNATQSGTLFLVAAGNSGPSLKTIGTPGTSREALTIGASCHPDDATNSYCTNSSTPMIANFSSRGPVIWTNLAGQQETINKPEIIAPGHLICAARAAGTSMGSDTCGNALYRKASGTSMATPFAAGAAQGKGQVHVENAILKNGAPSTKIQIIAGLPITLQNDYKASSNSFSQSISIKNISTGSLSLVPSSSSLNGAIKISYDKTSYALSAGQTISINMNITVDNYLVNEGAHDAFIILKSGTEEIKFSISVISPNRLSLISQGLDFGLFSGDDSSIDRTKSLKLINNYIKPLSINIKNSWTSSAMKLTQSLLPSSAFSLAPGETIDVSLNLSGALNVMSNGRYDGSMLISETSGMVKPIALGMTFFKGYSIRVDIPAGEFWHNFHITNKNNPSRESQKLRGLAESTTFFMRTKSTFLLGFLKSEPATMILLGKEATPTPAASISVKRSDAVFTTIINPRPLSGEYTSGYLQYIGMGIFTQDDKSVMKDANDITIIGGSTYSIISNTMSENFVVIQKTMFSYRSRNHIETQRILLSGAQLNQNQSITKADLMGFNKTIKLYDVEDFGASFDKLRGHISGNSVGDGGISFSMYMDLPQNTLAQPPTLSHYSNVTGASAQELNQHRHLLRNMNIKFDNTVTDKTLALQSYHVDSNNKLSPILYYLNSANELVTNDNDHLRRVKCGGMDGNTWMTGSTPRFFRTALNTPSIWQLTKIADVWALDGIVNADCSFFSKRNTPSPDIKISLIQNNALIEEVNIPLDAYWTYLKRSFQNIAQLNSTDPVKLRMENEIIINKKPYPILQELIFNQGSGDTRPPAFRNLYVSINGQLQRGVDESKTNDLHFEVDAVGSVDSISSVVMRVSKDRVNWQNLSVSMLANDSYKAVLPNLNSEVYWIEVSAKDAASNSVKQVTPIIRTTASVEPPSPCQRVAPSLTLSPSSFTGKAGDSFSTSLTVKNNDQNCADNTYSLTTLNLPAGWTSGALSNITLASGATKILSAKIVSSSSAKDGLYQPSIKVQDLNNSSMSASKALSITLNTPTTPGCIKNPAQIIISPNKQSSADKVSLTYSVTLTNKNQSCGLMNYDLSLISEGKDLNGSLSRSAASLSDGQSLTFSASVDPHNKAKPGLLYFSVEAVNQSDLSSASGSAIYELLESSGGSGGSNGGGPGVCRGKKCN
jgi:subtilisin family serine protease